MKTTLLIPTMNEIEGLRAIMPKIDPNWVDQILIVDANSTDGTIEYAKEHGYDIVIQESNGLRQAYLESLESVVGDVIIFFSPDGNSIPEKIPELVEKMREGYDMVIVSRYKDDAKSEDDDFITAFGNWMFTNLINVVHGGKYTDAMVMFRAIKKNLIKDLELDRDWTYWPEKIFFTKMCWMPVLSIRSALRKLKVGEIPGDEPPRIGGERKLQVVRWGSAYMSQVLTERFLFR